MPNQSDITKEDIEEWLDDYLASIPDKDRPPKIIDASDTHYYFDGPQYWGFVLKEKWDVAMQEALEKYKL